MTFESAYTDPYRLNRDGKGEQPVVPVAAAPDNTFSPEDAGAVPITMIERVSLAIAEAEARAIGVPEEAAAACLAAADIVVAHYGHTAKAAILAMGGLDLVRSAIDHILNTTGSPYTVDELTRIKAGL